MKGWVLTGFGNLDTDRPASSPALCVIVPAHNEAGAIGRTLAALAPLGQTAAAGQLIVVCNACTDETAELAAQTAPAARVITIAERGKANAINRALDEADPGIVIVVDSDVIFSPGCLEALVTTLASPGVMAASPVGQFDLAHSPWIVRAYYRVFVRQPYLSEGVGGSGVYGLSMAGREALGRLPLVIGDDHYVRSFFPQAQQRRVACTASGTPVHVVVHPPHTLRALLHTEHRSRMGDQEVRRLLPDAPPSHARTVRWLISPALRQPLEFIAFLAIKLLVRARLARRKPVPDRGWTPIRRG